MGGPPGTETLESLSSVIAPSCSPGVDAIASDWRRSKRAATARARCSPVRSGDTAHSQSNLTTAAS